MKIHTEEDEIIKLELKTSGEKKVSAKDISKNSQVDIANPNLHIAEITDKNGSLEMEIFISKGLGYGSIEGREGNDKEVGYIEIDSIFSPIRAVSVNVENVRVGKMTNWEKLIVNITTDGTLSYEDSFKEAVKILVEQFNFLLNPKNNPKKSEDESGEGDLSSLKDKAKIKKDKDTK